jgi:hypothetical protein
MTTFFVVCAALGGGVLVVQLLLGLLGVVDAGGDMDAGGGHDGGHGHIAAEGLDLLSVRALSAGVAFFGLGGLNGSEVGGLQPHSMRRWRTGCTGPSGSVMPTAMH